ncbi:MAG: UvrD-helicase domain-containing protein, partial [Woeseiaceae bacterium]
MSSDNKLLAADQQARVNALDVNRSFLVQAPVGSGKTELLIQRYLRLLGTVENPEEVLAITFTRKAAAEMRLRVLEALQHARDGAAPGAAHQLVTHQAALEVLERDAVASWGLIGNPRRLRIQTLDSLNAMIARMQPLTATGATAGHAIVDESRMSALAAQAAAATLDWLGAEGAESVATRNVLRHVDNNTGLYIRYLARMLGTRDQWLPFVSHGKLSDAEASALRERFEANLQRTVSDHLETLHRLCPQEHVAEMVALADYAAGNLGLDSPDEQLQERASWQLLGNLLLTDKGCLRKRISVTQGFPPEGKDQKRRLGELIDSLREQEEFLSSLHGVRLLPPTEYSDDQWSVLVSLFRLLPLAVAEFRRLCIARGITDHIDVALSAGAALGTADEPGDVALLLDYQVRHILVDEMQDTSKAQYRMLEALTGGWEPGDGRTLFCVGDPMQSIYRFRNAEVAQFLLARENGIGPVQLEPLVLRRNFRSGDQLVDWFNRVFPGVLALCDDAVNGAVAYSESVPDESLAGMGETRVYPVFGADREAEAAIGCRIIQETLEAFPDDSMAVLVRSRPHLPRLLARLREAGIAYQAVDIDRLTDLPEVIDVLALTRALAHEGDRIAWLALLRSPWLGLDWTDIHSLVTGAPQQTVPDLLDDAGRLARLSDTGQRGVQRFMEILQPQHASN